MLKGPSELNTKNLWLLFKVTALKFATFFSCAYKYNGFLPTVQIIYIEFHMYMFIHLHVQLYIHSSKHSYMYSCINNYYVITMYLLGYGINWLLDSLSLSRMTTSLKMEGLLRYCIPRLKDADFSSDLASWCPNQLLLQLQLTVHRWDISIIIIDSSEPFVILFLMLHVYSTDESSNNYCLIRILQTIPLYYNNNVLIILLIIHMCATCTHVQELQDRCSTVLSLSDVCAKGWLSHRIIPHVKLNFFWYRRLCCHKRDQNNVHLITTSCSKLRVSIICTCWKVEKV